MCLVRARQIAVRDIPAAVCLQAVVLEPCICQWNPAIVLQEPVDFIIGDAFLECWWSLTVKIEYSSNLISSASYLQMPNAGASCVTGYVEIMTRIMVRVFLIYRIETRSMRRGNLCGYLLLSFCV